jgi:hypothetical protein
LGLKIIFIYLFTGRGSFGAAKFLMRLLSLISRRNSFEFRLYKNIFVYLFETNC